MTAPESVGLSATRIARLKPLLEKHIGPDKLAGSVTLLARRGEIVHLNAAGLQDRENNRPMSVDTIFRIFSMTKPIACCALMTLYEQGLFQLITPVANFIPEFGKLKVFAGQQEDGSIMLEPLNRPITIRDLMTHTSGLSYHWLEYGPVEEMYRQAEVSSEKPLADFVADLLKLPLAFQPGTKYRYSYAHDVCAYLVELISGKPFDQYLQETIFDPLDMVDTGFFVPEDKLERFAAMYGSMRILHNTTTVMQWFAGAMAGQNNLLTGPNDSLESAPHNCFRGGHGLVSTAVDYYKFCQMLLNGGSANGHQLLSRKTIELMTANHLAPELLPYEIGGLPSPGLGYGLGFRTMMDIGQAQMMGTVDEYGWGGAANTYFWIDPKEEMIGVQMSQFQPSGYHTLAADFRTIAYQSIID